MESNWSQDELYLITISDLDEHVDLDFGTGAPKKRLLELLDYFLD